MITSLCFNFPLHLLHQHYLLFFHSLVTLKKFLSISVRLSKFLTDEYKEYVNADVEGHGGSISHLQAHGAQKYYFQVVNQRHQHCCDGLLRFSLLC